MESCFIAPAPCRPKKKKKVTSIANISKMMQEEVPQFDGKVSLMCMCNIDKQKAEVIYKRGGNVWFSPY